MSEQAAAETPQNPLLSALHLHIQGVAGQPITARMLLELEKTCMLARELLAIGKAPEAINKRAMMGQMGGVQFADPLAMYESGVSSGPFYAQAALSAPAETFGAQAIREFTSVLSGLVKPPEPERQLSFSDMAQAIESAQRANDHETVTQLRAILAAEVARAPAPVADVTPITHVVARAG